MAATLLMFTALLATRPSDLVEVPIFVDAAELTRRLEALVLAEIPRAVLSSSTAEGAIGLSVERAESALWVRIFSERDGLLLSRDVPLQDGLDPALRLVLVLFARAVNVSSDLAAERPAELDGATERPAASIEVFAGISSTFWSPIRAPQLGLVLGAAVQVFDLEYGISSRLSGLLCCEPSTDEIVAHALELAILVEGGLRVFDASPIAVGLHAAFGVNVVWGQATLMLSPSVEQPIGTQAGPLGRLGGSAELRLFGHIHLSLLAGLELRAPYRELVLNDAPSGEALSAGPLTPWAEVRVGLF